jgi:hypothetical protein
MLKKLRFIYLLLFQFQILCAQEISTNTRKIKIQIAPGISEQNFAFQKYMERPRSYSVQASSSAVNAKGLGVTLPIYISNSNYRTGLLINPILRYDLVDHKSSLVKPQRSEYGLLSDLHMSVFKHGSLKYKKVKLPIKIGVGYSFISPFQAFDYPFQVIHFNPPARLINSPKTYLDFRGIHTFIMLSFLKGVTLKQQLMYVPKNQILYNGYWHAMMYHISIEIEPKVFLKRKKSS